MKAFHFSLEAILTLREQKEQDAQQEYGRRLCAAEAVSNRLETIRREVNLWREHLRRCFRQGAVAAELASIQGYGGVLAERENEAVTELSAARAAQATAWASLLKATQEREALEKLRQRQRREYEYEVGREEQRIADDRTSRPASVGLMALRSLDDETL